MTIDITALDVLPESEPTEALVDLDGTGLARCSWTCLITCLVTGFAN